MLTTARTPFGPGGLATAGCWTRIDPTMSRAIRVRCTTELSAMYVVCLAGTEPGPGRRCVRMSDWRDAHLPDLHWAPRGLSGRQIGRASCREACRCRRTGG